MGENTALEQKFQDYYTTTFSSDLSKWFEIKKQFGGMVVNFIPHADGRYVPNRPSRCSEVDEYGFSVACFYTFLVPQIVALSTECFDSFFLFSQASGWPVLSCGMGGFMSPAQILKEADLEPYSNERSRYISMLKAVEEYFIQDVKKFLAGKDPNLDGEAYERLCELAQGKIEKITQGISEQVDAYVSYLKGESKYQGYLMSQKFMSGKK